MARTSLVLDILTPLGPKRQGIDVPGVEIPGLLGELGVLPDHVPYVTAVTPGVVRFRDGVTSARVAVGAGFLEVTEQGHVVLLVERAAEAGEIDVPGVQARLREVDAELAQHKGALDEAVVQPLHAEHRWLEAQLRAAAS